MTTKTRIKCIVRADGTKEYTAQYRMFPLYWKDFSCYGSAWEKSYDQQKLSGKTIKYTSLEFCKLIIDKHFELLDSERKKQEARKVDSVEYVKYP